MILVTGGTGFVGREIIRQLHGVGHRVRVLARHPKRASDLVAQYDCEIAVGDVLDPASLDRAMSGVTAVVHLVGIIYETPRVSFEQAHTQATANVLAAARAAGVRRYIQMSALGTRPKAVSRYHQSKFAAEELVRQSGLDWTILRPSLITGAGDKSLNLLSSFFRAPLDFLNCYTFPNLGGGTSLVQPISVEEVACAFVRALSNTVAVGKTYDLCGPEPIRWSDLLLLLAKKQGARAKFDNTTCGFIIRSLLWAALIAIPMFGAVFFYFGMISIERAVILTAVWAGLLVIARGWTTILIYPVAWRYPLAAAWLAEKLLPRWLHFGEQLNMLAEDNVGDPLPAQRDLHLQFKSIRETWRASR